MTRVLILANEHVNRRMAGPAIRCFELARALSAAGQQVTLAAPHPSDLPRQPFPIVRYDGATLEGLAADHDVVLLQGWVMERFPALRDCGARLVVDLYDPFPLEDLILLEEEPMEVRVTAQQRSVRALTDQVRDGDFFLCASEKQRDFWIGWLCALNRVNPWTYEDDASLRRLIDVVPFGVPGEAPRRLAPAYRGVVPGIGASDLVLLWGGGIYNWFDPVSLIRGVAIAAAVVPDLRLIFMSTGHPNPEIRQMWTQIAARRVADELELTGRHVFFNDGWVEYERRADWLLEADVGVSTHFEHVETRFSFRTRVLDYLWCGLPVISTAGDTLGDLIEARGLGRTVAAEDPSAIARAIVELASDAEERRACSARAAGVAHELQWARVVEPLRRYCAEARRAPDLAAVAPLRRVPVQVDGPTPASPPAAPPTAAEHLMRVVHRRLPSRLASSRGVRLTARLLRRMFSRARPGAAR